MTSIASRPDHVHTALELNAKTKVPLPTVSKILGQMARADLLQSNRGIGGGFLMNHKIEDISIADIIEAVDGPVQLTSCLSDLEPGCHCGSGCMTRSKWDKINNAVYDALNTVSLSEMVNDPYDFMVPLGGDLQGKLINQSTNQPILMKNEE